MTEKVVFQGVRCTDTRLNLVWEALLNLLGVPKHTEDLLHGSGYYYDAITIPGGAGLLADQKWLYSKSAALIKAHQTEVVILTAHDDCAAKGNYEEFLENVAEYNMMLVREGIKCTTLAFYFQHVNNSWSVLPLLSSTHILSDVICKYRNIDRDVVESKFSWLSKNTIRGFE